MKIYEFIDCIFFFIFNCTRVSFRLKSLVSKPQFHQTTFRKTVESSVIVRRIQFCERYRSSSESASGVFKFTATTDASTFGCSLGSFFDILSFAYLFTIFHCFTTWHRRNNNYVELLLILFSVIIVRSYNSSICKIENVAQWRTKFIKGRFHGFFHIRLAFFFCICIYSSKVQIIFKYCTKLSKQDFVKIKIK